MEPNRPLLAHSANVSGQRHALVAHLCQVATLASSYAASFGMSELAYALGLYHDLGKAHPDFQHYLLQAESGKRARGPEHKLAGVLLALEQGYGAAALVLQGHHGGLQTPAALKTAVSDPGLVAAAREALGVSQAMLRDLGAIPPPHWPAHINDPLYAELLVRMLFSALVDADYTDTAAHFAPSPPWPQRSLSDLWARFESDHRRFLAPRSAVDLLREEIYSDCLRAAELSPGMFRLAVPTGGGKTLSAMGFALRHALRHGLERVIVAVPFISITEQTAST